ncbi:MOSC domain-containing protein [Halogranum rubrum]|uniref:MOSC domain-containing protein n=2 Tax=Halogranum rubrum TaxID=553466 RepID=A0A1I4GEN8_9EURY|nr:MULTISPECIES: MOSC domain-containing protein [Halogranum]EJN59793.1 MOSC domain containing protein [Halogranum salarium B-1]SFL28522.1 MOSC domain-containing protein [Halogranum rubrum]
MNGQGAVEGVFVTATSGGTVERRDEVDALAGRGLRGDRHCKEQPSDAGDDVTLIEREALDAIRRESGIELAPGEHRRNVETRDVALNHLVGERFRVGDAVCRGVELCEPCNHLQQMTEDGVLQALLHRGGLRAEIVEGGTIRSGDAVVSLD